jgi:hypothetical protein
MVDEIQLRLVRRDGFWCCRINSLRLFLVMCLHWPLCGGFLIIATF